MSEASLLLRVEDVAVLLGIGRSKAWELLASGAIPSVKVGRCRRVLRIEVEAYVANLPTEGCGA